MKKPCVLLVFLFLFPLSLLAAWQDHRKDIDQDVLKNVLQEKVKKFIKMEAAGSLKKALEESEAPILFEVALPDVLESVSNLKEDWLADRLVGHIALFYYTNEQAEKRLTKINEILKNGSPEDFRNVMAELGYTGDLSKEQLAFDLAMMDVVQAFEKLGDYDFLPFTTEDSRYFKDDFDLIEAQMGDLFRALKSRFEEKYKGPLSEPNGVGGSGKKIRNLIVDSNASPSDDSAAGIFGFSQKEKAAKSVLLSPLSDLKAGLHLLGANDSMESIVPEAPITQPGRAFFRESWKRKIKSAIAFLEDFAEYIQVKAADGPDTPVVIEFDTVGFTEHKVRDLYEGMFKNEYLNWYVSIGLTRGLGPKQHEFCPNGCNQDILNLYNEKLGVQWLIGNHWKDTKELRLNQTHLNFYLGGILYKLSPAASTSLSKEIEQSSLWGMEFGWHFYDLFEFNLGAIQLHHWESKTWSSIIPQANLSVSLLDYIEAL